MTPLLSGIQSIYCRTDVSATHWSKRSEVRESVQWFTHAATSFLILLATWSDDMPPKLAKNEMCSTPSLQYWSSWLAICYVVPNRPVLREIISRHRPSGSGISRPPLKTFINRPAEAAAVLSAASADSSAYANTVTTTSASEHVVSESDTPLVWASITCCDVARSLSTCVTIVSTEKSSLPAKYACAEVVVATNSGWGLYGAYIQCVSSSIR